MHLRDLPPPLLLVSACGDVRTRKDDGLAQVCLAHDHLKFVARVDTMTGVGDNADEQLQADLVCEAAVVPDPYKGKP